MEYNIKMVLVLQWFYNKTNGFCTAFTTSAEKLYIHLPSSFIWQNDGDIEQEKTFFSFKHVRKQTVLRHLLNLSSNKASGRNDIPARLLKDDSYALAEPLAYIINKSLKQSVVLDSLKVAKVIPLLKTGSLKSFENCRLISVLPAIS